MEVRGRLRGTRRPGKLMAELAWRVASRAKGREEGIISTTGGGWRGLGVIAGWWEIPGGTVSPGHSVCYLPTGTPSPIINPWWLPFIMSL